MESSEGNNCVVGSCGYLPWLQWLATLAQDTPRPVVGASSKSWCTSRTGQDESSRPGSSDGAKRGKGLKDSKKKYARPPCCWAGGGKEEKGPPS